MLTCSFSATTLHPQTKVNSPAVTGAEARQAQRELKDRVRYLSYPVSVMFVSDSPTLLIVIQGVTPPKRGMGARIARLRMKWHSNGRATSKTAAQPY